MTNRERMELRRVFIAGTIQGANADLRIDDQGYREQIAALVRARFPEAECFDPSTGVTRQLADPTTMSVIGKLIGDVPPVLDLGSLPAELAALRATFNEMTREAADCDLCIAFLPGRTLSMGTAMEMQAAFSAGVPVVAVTSLVDNLAVMSVSSWVARDLDALAGLLDGLREMSVPLPERGHGAESALAGDAAR
ncbi:hypothetical protein [Streptomyces sp. NPDC008317]|uniref:hypothetical protein n=1 Tax=Streptomyces sp. NPDC008317 TaxID=3364827 RepID=UPI0036E6237A